LAGLELNREVVFLGIGEEHKTVVS
jgi:hypothetical protein